MAGTKGKLRIGLLGAGAMGGVYARNMTAISEVEAIGVCARTGKPVLLGGVAV